VTTPGDDRARLEARNAALRGTMDELLEKFERQTEQLRSAQASAAALSATVTSADGLVRATIDASGSLAQLHFAPTTFERTTPAALANTVLAAVRQGGNQVKQQLADLMRPITEGLPDLPDLIEGAPSLSGLVPEIPDFTEEQAEPEAPRPDPFEDPLAESSTHAKRNPPPPPPAPPATPAPKPTSRRVRPAPVEDEEPPDSWLRGRD
jgi:DNA-binding protein YbaB